MYAASPCSALGRERPRDPRDALRDRHPTRRVLPSRPCGPVRGNAPRPVRQGQQGPARAGPRPRGPGPRSVPTRDAPQAGPGPTGDGALPLPRGRRLHPTSLNLLVWRYGRAARIPDRPSVHALRHACATHLLAGGADVHDDQQLLGHRGLETTAVYTKVTIKDLKEVVAKAHPRERALLALQSSILHTTSHRRAKRPGGK